MFAIDLDPAKNRMVLHIEGLLQDAEAHALADLVLARAAELKPGFDVINDLGKARPLSQVQLVEVRRASEGLVKLGMRRLVRVVGASAIAAMQFQRESQAAAQVSALAMVATLEEAHAALDRG